MIEQIDINKLKINNEGDEAFEYDRVFVESFVDLSEDLKLPPTALSIGQHEYKGRMYRNNTFSYGEFSAIVAASKTKKTFFKSALVAAYIGGQTNRYFPNIRTHRQGEPYIIDIDTEQGEYYAQRSFRRVAELVGETYNNYLSFGLEGLDSNEIVRFIDELLKDRRYKNNIKWMSIDGIADLVDDTNDIKQSVYVASKIKRWRKENQMHINTVIHKTSTSDKATGHLGSAIQKKSESVILLKDTDENPEVKNSPIKVSQIYSRGAPFDPFHFKLNDETLPYECDIKNEEWQ